MSSSRASSNKEVKRLVDASSKKDNGTCGKYTVSTEEKKLLIAKWVSEMGVSNTIWQFQKEFAEYPKESTACTWMNSYERELSERHKCGCEEQMKKLPSKRRGHPPVLGDILDDRVREQHVNVGQE